MKNLEQELELRMYFFVPYNISEIQKGIQSLHAAQQYCYTYHDEPQFIDFIQNWKTVIILNGETTNTDTDFEDKPLGILNQIVDKLMDNDIKFDYFIEPDLNNALTAVCFICDERVFNKKKYPDFQNYMTLNGNEDSDVDTEYKAWVRLIGGVKNAFLRELIQDKKLA